jgi:hypothetical protein
MTVFDHPSTSGQWSKRDWIALVLLMVTVGGLYIRTCNFDFVDIDDSDYVTGNPNVTSGLTIHNLHVAWTTIMIQNWSPLTMMGLQFIDGCFGTRPGPFHVANTLLHAVNTALLFVFLRKATNQYWPALFSAGLWGLHPLRVESVAWISEFKDVLCGCTSLLCMLAYLRYSRRRTAGPYAIVALMLVLALLSKPMAVTLPVALLLLDFWPLKEIAIPAELRRRWWMWRGLEKLPLLACSVAAILLALVSQQTAMGSASHFSLSIRLENAVVSIAAYLRDCFWPTGLSFFYPHPAMLTGQIAWPTLAVAGVLLVGLTLAAVLFYRSFPVLFVGWFWFILTLLPVLGLIQVGEQSRADRYTYIPAMMLTTSVVWLTDALASALRSQRIASVVAILLAVALSITTEMDVSNWRDSIALFTRADEMVPDNFFAKALLASELRADGRHKPAMKLAAEAARLSPHAWAPRFYLGLLLMDEKRFDEASQALSITPMPAKNWYALGLVSSAEADQCLADAGANPGDVARERAAIFEKQACDCLRRSLGLDGNNPAAADLLAQQINRLGDIDHAIQIWTDLTVRFPGYGTAHGHLGDALLQTNRVNESLAEYRMAIALGERDPAWESALALGYVTRLQPSPMSLQELTALATDARAKTGGQDPAALDALAACLARAGQFDEAISTADAAVAQADRLKQSALAIAIRKRLTFYQAGQPYIDRDR